MKIAYKFLFYNFSIEQCFQWQGQNYNFLVTRSSDLIACLENVTEIKEILRRRNFESVRLRHEECLVNLLRYSYNCFMVQCIYCFPLLLQHKDDKTM